MVIAVTTDEHEAAFNRYRRIINLKWTAEKCFLEIGKELCEFQQLEQWRDLEYNSFNAFLADPDVNISRRTAYRMMRIWKQYVIEMNIQTEKLIAIGGTKLDMIASHVDQGNVDRWLNTAATLSKSDLKAELDGTEPTYTPLDWRSQLREARAIAFWLAECEVCPQELREFSLDYWVQTEAWG